jgi:predicted DCC family thiol-disulfide oxidoreductase YuxK
MNSNIIYFDGICSLCNQSVDFIIRRDKRDTFLFAPLQGETAKQYLPKQSTEELKSIVLQQDGILYYQSDAALKILYSLGGFWKLSALFFIIPKFIRNYIYSIISKNRYAWFGKKSTCRIPSPEERKRFLP